jgi:hypothetical protein
MKKIGIKVKLIISILLLIIAFACSKSEKLIKITDSRSGKVVVVKCDDCFKINGQPPTITVLPLKPEVIGAVLSQYDSFVEKAMKDRDKNPKANFFLMSLHDPMSRGNLEGVVQRILYYEFFGEALP